MMKRLLLLLNILLLTNISTAQRYDNFASTVASASGIGNLMQAIPSAKITVCGFPGTGGIPCTNTVPTFTDQTLTVSCGTTTQVVLQGTNTCVANSDTFGNFGFWIAPGPYQYCISANNVSTQCFNIDVTSGSGAIKPATGDAVQYVSLSGSDTNDGLSWGTAKATINGAAAALPNCTATGITIASGAAGPTFTVKCGVIQLGATSGATTTTFALSSALSFVSTLVKIQGQGKFATAISCGAAISTCITFNSDTAWYGPGSAQGVNLADLTLIGTNTSGQIGVLSVASAFTARDIRVMNFNGTNGECMELQNDSIGFSERSFLQNVGFDNCTNQLVLNSTSTVPTFGHITGHHVQFSLQNGQTAILNKGNAQIYSGYFTGVINTNGPGTNAYTAVSIAGTGTFAGMFDFQVDNGGGGTVTMCSGCTNANFQTWGFSANDNGLTFNDTPLTIGTSTIGTPLKSLTFCHLSGPGTGQCGDLPNRWIPSLDGSGNLGFFVASPANELYFLINNPANAGIGIGPSNIRQGGTGNFVLPATAGDTLVGRASTDTMTGIKNFPGNTAALTADWTCGTGGTVASCTSATIIGSGGGVPLTFTLPLVATSYTLECDGVVGQATAVTLNQWNLLTATNGATNVTANYSMATAATASAYGAVTDQASTTTTFQITPSWTLGAINTKMPFHIWAKIEGASASGTVVSLQLLAPTVGDLVTIFRGTVCRLF